MIAVGDTDDPYHAAAYRKLITIRSAQIVARQSTITQSSAIFRWWERVSSFFIEQRLPG